VGFRITVSIPAADGLTDEALEAEVGAQPQLTGHEADAMFTAARAAAEALCAALPGDGPFVVHLTGADFSRNAGETSFLRVEVGTNFTHPVDENGAMAAAPVPDEAALKAEGEAAAAAAASDEGSAESWAGQDPAVNAPPADVSTTGDAAPVETPPAADATPAEPAAGASTEEPAAPAGEVPPDGALTA
jgi:hypothetical protein